MEQWSPSTNFSPSWSVARRALGDGDGEDDSSFMRFGGRERVELALGLGDFIHLSRAKKLSQKIVIIIQAT